MKRVILATLERISLRNENNYKFISVLILIVMLISIMSNTAYATTKKLDVIKKSSDTKYLENNQGYISKTIVDSNQDTGEVNIEIKLSNSKKETDAEKQMYTEIFLVIDNSPSMDFTTSSGKTRKEIVIESTKTLVESIFNVTNNVKIGIVDFHGVSGWFGSAEISNAKLRKKLTDSKEDVITELSKLDSAETVSGTNIDAGLQMAERNFSEACKNKVIVLLTDGVPNADVKGNHASNDPSTDDAKKVQETTKETLQRLDQEGYNIISMMTGMDETDGNTDKDGNVYEKGSLEEDLKAIERIFGTPELPTAGKYYLVKSMDVSSVISNDILSDVMEKIQNPIKNVKIVDYFPQDITDNFEFSYVEKPSLGTTSETIDTENKTITWDIGTLRGDEETSLKYKLKLKDMNNQQLLNKVISTNEKVILTYEDSQDKEYTVTLSSSPQIKLREIQDLTATVSYSTTTTTEGPVVATITTNNEVYPVEGWTLSDNRKSMTKTYTTNKTETVTLKDYDEQTKEIIINVNNIVKPTQVPTPTEHPQNPINQPEKDDTIANKVLPKAGVNYVIIIIGIVVIVAGIIGYKKYNEYKDVE